jgi:hypothetical protein
MPSKSNLEKRILKLEKALTPEEIVQIVISVIDRAFDEEITADEAYEQLEEVKRRYLDPMDYAHGSNLCSNLGSLKSIDWATPILRPLSGA